MIKNYSIVVATELGIKEQQVNAVITLITEGGTVPFIARYRKEATGSLDEVIIAKIRDRVEQLKEMDKRRETILKTIEEQGKLTVKSHRFLIEAQKKKTVAVSAVS